MAPNTDPNLVNAWGLTSGPTTPWWVADNGTDKSTLYRGSDGQPQALVVNVHNAPTGTVFNPTTGFVLPTGGKALFLFDTEEGKVLGWNRAQGTNAVVVADLDDGAIYKGLAIADTPPGPRLYAADFHNAQVDVFDGSFSLVTRRLRRPEPAERLRAVRDPDDRRPRVRHATPSRTPTPRTRSPARARASSTPTTSPGTCVGRVAQHGQLNAPWGLALAPSTFGRFAGDLLVGNFGDGQINAYAELGNGHFAHRGELRDSSGKSLSIDGLWALQFGKGGNNGPAGTLFFTAGPDDESHGLFGQIVGG